MKKIIILLLAIIVALNLTACAGGASVTTAAATQAPAANQPAANQPAAQAAQAETASAQAQSTAADSSADALAGNSKGHEDADDYTWDSAAVVAITLNGNSITAGGEGVKVEGSKATITSAGTYSISGSLADGKIIVDTEDKAVVRIILSGADIHNSTSAPVTIQNAKKAVIILAEGTENVVSDASAYVFATPEEDEPNAAIFSKSDLTIYGSGSLTVNGNFNDGIASKDGLIINAAAVTVTAVDDGIRGKDYLVVKGGSITVTAQGDGLKADNAEEEGKGYVSVAGGVLNITAAGDAITAESDVIITAGEMTLTSGGGSSRQVDNATSAKGIKGVASVIIDGGTFTINSADDAIHSNASVVVNGGTFAITTGDDGMHADAMLEINGGEIRITESYEGLESAVITINAGSFHIASSDDGINVASGKDGSGAMGRGGRPGQDAFTYSGSNYLYINGGYIVVNAFGDGLDINGAVAMTDGVLLVSGPLQQNNGALDYDAGWNMTGGLVVAAGSVGMAQVPGENSSQNSVLINLTSVQQAGMLIHIADGSGKNILTFAPEKQYQSVAFSSPELVNGATYTISLGGSCTGAVTDGLYQGGDYSSGTKYESFTISGVVTMIGSGGMGGPGGPGGRRRP
jgi:hypothetical protein